MLIFCKREFAYLIRRSQRAQHGIPRAAVLHCRHFRDIGDKSMDSLKTLYHAHISTLQQRAQQVLARFKLDAMLISADTVAVDHRGVAVWPS